MKSRRLAVQAETSELAEVRAGPSNGISNTPSPGGGIHACASLDRIFLSPTISAGNILGASPRKQTRNTLDLSYIECDEFFQQYDALLAGLPMEPLEDISLDPDLEYNTCVLPPWHCLLFRCRCATTYFILRIELFCSKQSDCYDKRNKILVCATQHLFTALCSDASSNDFQVLFML